MCMPVNMLKVRNHLNANLNFKLSFSIKLHYKYKTHNE